jgi:RHS repeat-associated protein
MGLLIGLAGGVNPGWAEPAETSTHVALQQALINGLATGQDVQQLLHTLRQQPAPTARRPMWPKHTVSGDLKAQLTAFRDVLYQTLQQPLSSASITALAQTYQRLQATHMLMLSRFDHVQNELQHTAAPERFEDRRQDALSHYDSILKPLFTPLAAPLVEWQQAPDRTALLDTTAFRQTVREALRETVALLKPHLREPAPPILRAQTLPVRPASLVLREPRIEPVMQPSYARPDPPEPQPADLAGTPDAPLHEAILLQAQALHHDAIRIYEFVRNEIETQDYAGAMKGALGTLRQKSGNAVDQASLLIALLRASSLPARYVHGVIRLPIEHVTARLGIAISSNASPHIRALRATAALSAAGIAHRPIIAGGRVTAVELESSWVSAYVPYTNYRGAMVDTSGSIWVPLMPAIKDTAVEPAARTLHDIETPVETLIADYLAQPQPADLRTYLEEALVADLPKGEGASTDTPTLGSRHLIPVRLGLLPATLPAEVVVVTEEAPVLDDTHRQWLRLVARAGVRDSAPIILDHTVPVAEVASERLTLSYLPATVDDQRVTNLYGGLDNVPAYLVKLRPQLKRHGRLLAVATDALDTGVPYRFEIHLIGPAGSEQVTQTLISGSYHAIGITAQACAFVAVDPDDPGNTEFSAAALLYRVAVEYSQQWTEAEDVLAAWTDVALVRPWPHVVMVSNAMQVDTIAGRPHQLGWRGVTLDAALRLSTPIARHQERRAERDWLQLSALQGSLLEHRVFEQLFLVDSISADKGLQLARAQGVPVHRIETQNLQAVLPSLSHPQAVLDAIAAWVGLGLTVDVPATPLQYQDWQGSVWRVVNPDTGAAGYFIAGGLAGGATSLGPTAWALTLLRDALASPNTASPNTDPLSAASIQKVLVTDAQIGDVGDTLPRPLAVYVRDLWGRPVQGALVTFEVTAGGACLAECKPAVSVLTDAQGIASVPLTLGALTSVNPVDIRLQPQDPYPTRVSINWVDASVPHITGRRLSVPRPFVALGKPKPVANLAFTGYLGNEMPTGQSRYRVGDYQGSFNVSAVDANGNPVSNVNLVVAASDQALQPSSYCDYIPTHIIGDNNRVNCPIHPPIAWECGSQVDAERTDLLGTSAFHILVGDGTSEDIITVSAPDHPHVPPLTYRYSILACEWPSMDLFYYNFKEPTDAHGHFVNAAIAGQTASYPLYLDVYQHKYSLINADLSYLVEDDTSDRQWHRVEHPKPLWVTVERCVHPSGCAEPNPMRYIGNGRYETHIKTNPTPGRNGGTIRFFYLDREATDDIHHVNGDTNTYQQKLIVHGWKHRDIPFAGVTGLRLQTTVSSQGVPKDSAADAIYLNIDNRSRYPVHLNYTIEPADYHALYAAVYLFKGGVLQAVLPGSALSGQGRALIPRGFDFDPAQTYTAQLVLNQNSKVPVHADPTPLTIVPGSPKLITEATQSLYVSQEMDVVNQRSCLHSASLAFTLSEEARVSLVFRDAHDEQRTLVQIDDQVFAKGQHQLPFYVSAIRSYASDQPAYALDPGTYRFALTAISTDTTDPKEDAVLGRAVVEYQTNQLPVGRTLVRGVDVSNGNLILSTTDLEVPGRGAHLTFRRSYSANTTRFPGPLGVGWRHNYQSRVVRDACGAAIITGGIGGGSRFINVQDNQGKEQWTPLKGYHGTLRHHNADDTFDFYSPDGTQYHYRKVLGGGHLLDYIADSNGNVTQLGYDPADAQRLITVEDPSKRRFIFNYDTRTFTIDGLPTQTSVMTEIQAPGGQRLFLDYDTHGNLVRAARENEARVETYTYFPNHPVVLDPATHTIAKLHGKLETYTNPNGITTTYSHGTHVQERIVTIAIPGGGQVAKPMSVAFPFVAVNEIQAPGRGATKFVYDHLDRRTIVTNGRGASTLYTLNDDGTVFAQQDALGNATRTTWSARHLLPESRTDARDVTTTYAYDDNGNVLRETVAGTTTTYTYAQLKDGTIKNRVASKTDRSGNTTRFAYDERGNLVNVTDAMGGVTTHIYSAKGDRLSTQDPLGHMTTFEYDAYGQVKTRTDALGGTTLTRRDERGRPVHITDARGRSTQYGYDTLNRVIERTDALGQVHTWTYDPVGNRTSETDEANRTTRFGYDAADRLVSITHALGATKTMSYDEQGNKTRETDFRGNLTTFTYDLADRMTDRLEPLGRQTQWQYDRGGNVLSETDALGRETQFAYDDLGRRITITDALGGITERHYDGEGHVTREVNANQAATALAYDALGRLVERIEPLGRLTTYLYDAVGNRVRETDANGNSTRFEYDALNRLMRRTDAMGEVTLYDYDAVGNVTREVDARRHETVHTYDPLNRLESTTDAVGYKTEYAYDEVGNVVQTTLPNHNVVDADYDALSRLTRQSDNLGLLHSYTYDADGNRESESDANGNTTTTIYDALSQWVRQELPENRTRHRAYDAVGNLTLEIDANGHPTTFAYDALNRLITTQDALGYTLERTYDAVGNKTSETDQRGHATRFTYDALNQLVEVTDPLGQSITYSYDLVGNRISETDKRGTSTRYTYDPVNRRLTTERASILLRQVEYDGAGNVVSDTDANGNITTYRYDPRHLVIMESRPLAAVTRHDYDAMGDRTATTDPEGRITTWTYDERQRMRTETNGAGETTTYTYDGNGNRATLKRPNGNTWTFAYDPANQLVEVRDPTGASTTYTYDDNGNRLTQTDANSDITAFSYDKRNRLESVQYPDEAVIHYTYDGSGNRTGETDANGQRSTSTYDALGRLEQTTYSDLLTPAGDDVTHIAYDYDANDNLVRVSTTYSGATGTRTTVRHYDPLDRLSDTTQADGAILSYGYDPQGNRLSLSLTGVPSTRYGYDELNRMASVITRQGITEYAYDRSSRLIRTAYPTGTEARQTYDSAGRIAEIEHIHYHVPIAAYAYRYDTNGNRTEEAITRGNVTEVTTYGYDAVDRLTDVIYPDRSTAYTYDAASNRLTEQSRSHADDTWLTDKTFQYNSRHQVTEVMNHLNSATTATYTYDAIGNRTQQCIGKQTTTYIYDGRHQLRQMTRGGSSLGAFLYDWQGLRVRKHTPSETRRYIYDDQSVVLITDDAGTPKSHYIHGPSGLLALDHVSEGPQYYLFDALGSVVSLSKPDGSLQAHYTYDVWGTMDDRVGGSANRFGFTGHELDGVSGLYYAKMRYYDPILGLFLTPDPVVGNPTNPLSLHSYLYAYQNPTVYIDPDGRESISKLIDRAAERCGVVACASLALAKGLYHIATAGFATVHDPIVDARDAGHVTDSDYYVYGIGGGLSVAGLNAATGRVGSVLVDGVKTIAGQAVTAAIVGAVSGSLDDATNQGINLAVGLQEGFSVSQNVKVASIGAFVGAGAVGLGHAASRHSELIAVSDAGPRSSQRIGRGTTAVVESQSSVGVATNKLPLSQTQIDEIRTIPHGQRPDPSEYLSLEYIQNHLSNFDGGASYLAPKAALDRWGRNPVGRADGQFVSPSYEVDDLLRRTKGNLVLIEKELGIPAGAWQGKEFVRIDIPNPGSMNVRMPWGNESGANSLWLPGGRLPTGKLEAVIDPVPMGSYIETDLLEAVKRTNTR